MANPQLEKGHLDIANELVEHLACTQLSGYESRIIWAIWRKTYCWHKKEDWISYSQFQELTKIGNWSHISRAIKRLLERNMITKNGNLYGFQKDYSRWELPKLVTTKKVTKIGQIVTKIGKKGLPKLVDTKENLTKETIQKKPSAPIGAGVNEAIKLFGALNPSYDQLFKRKVQREAAQRLLDRYGSEKLRRIIEGAVVALTDPYAPHITTPAQLEDGLGRLIAWGNSNNQKSKKVGMV